MSLALLRVGDTDQHRIELEIDTGTSPYYRIHLGKGIRREHGFTLLDEVRWSSPVQRNPTAGRHIDTRTRFLLDPTLATERGTLVQLESMRAPAGSGPAWSHPVAVPVLPRADSLRSHEAVAMSRPYGAAASLGLTASDGASTVPGHPIRTVPVRSARETYSRPASLEDLLGAVARIAGPVVLDLIQRTASGAGAVPATGGTGAPATDPTAAAVATLLQTVLGALSRGGGAQATASSLPDNRFALATEHAQPFIAPALLALAGPVLSSIAGPLVQALPELLNAANQHKLDSRREAHQHISDILAQVDRTRLLEQLISARSAAPAAGDGHGTAATDPPAGGPPLSEADVAALIGLLRSGATAPATTGTPASAGATTGTGATTPPGAASTGTTAGTLSLHRPHTAVRADAGAGSGRRTGRPSRAVLEHVVGPPVDRLGAPSVVFLRGRPLTLRFRLRVPPDGPSSAIPRAVLDLLVREPGGTTDLLVRQERLTDLRPGEVRSVSLSAAEVDALPADTDLDLTAAVRWPGGRDARQAACSSRIIVAGPQQVVSIGSQVGPRTELTDMTRFRGFWNRIWSSPSSDQAGKGPMWGLDVALRYSVVATASRTNGLMETRLNAEPQAHESVRVTTRGRMKSGLELAVAELNALLPLWPGEQPLDAETLAAFTAPAHLAGQGGDVVHRLRLEGRRDTRGLVWVVPAPTLRTFTVATVRETDAFGQVLTVEPREVHFPVIEAVRVLGLVSDDDEHEPSPSGYRFQGYRVALDDLVALDPAVPMRAVSGPTPAASAVAAAAGGP